MKSLGGLDAEFRHLAVHGGVGHKHGLATHGAILHVRLLRYRQVEREADAFPAMRTGGVLALQKIQCTLNIMVAVQPNSTWGAGVSGPGGERSDLSLGRVYLEAGRGGIDEE